MNYINKLIFKFNNLKLEKKYFFLLKLSKKKKKIPLKYKKNKFLIKNCQIKIWLYIKKYKKKIKIYCQSESNIINGIIYIIIKIIKKESLKNSIIYNKKFLKKINLLKIISINKYNSIIIIINNIKKYIKKNFK
ncbi:MAG: SufE family protein [Candidatus Shikimatogenerans sp. JK-2022]|nr:SufE family protein [Candidatus Shikimatogenerans bostrichidophilus]